MADARCSASTDNDSCVVALVPLRRWIAVDLQKWLAGTRDDDIAQRREEVLLHKITVAFGIAELLKHARDQLGSATAGEQCCNIDNFAVHVASPPSTARSPRIDVRGVEMLSPKLSVEIVEPFFLQPGIGGGGDDRKREDPLAGRYLEAEFPGNERAATAAVLAAVSQSEEDTRCHALGVLLYELFSLLSLRHTDGLGLAGAQEPARKKVRRPEDSLDAAAQEAQAQVPDAAGESRGGLPNSSSSDFEWNNFLLAKLGFPSSICILVRNLLECREEERPDEAYDSLETVSKDLHLLLLDPRRFLLDQPTASTAEDGNGTPRRLSFRGHKLYGRETEVTLITDAFCRVSSGHSEAFLVGGFSGSGKSRLVGSLMARVAAVGGYVLTHKFQQGSKEQTLLEVIAVINALCLLVRDRSSPGSLKKIVNNLMEMFGADLPVLALLLPNIEALIPNGRHNRGQDPREKKERDDQMDLRSVRFLLQRFMRAVSSSTCPVVLFLDDLQWCGDSALTVIEGLLCDASGSSCCLFVGSYRSNEVKEDHTIFRICNDLRAKDVPVTTLTLEGLGPAHLNSMISDALGTFPRVCEPLSDILFQKTKGNPFFVLEFMQMLEEERLLEYNTEERRWIWDEDRISTMDVAGNVLHILSSKMNGLPESTQSVLKTSACFGVIKEPVIRYLSTNIEYSDMRNGLKRVVAEGFMIKVGSSGYKFAHDKVREAAYGLIPDSEKNQYHFRLGITLYNATKSSNVDDIIFSMTDQINHGINDTSTQKPELIPDFVNLNERAGMKAVDCCDYVTARSYLNTAVSLLPTDHWKSCYNQSLRMYFSLAKSAHACGDITKAQEVLQQILEECRCMEDKLQAYYLLVTILIACGEGVKAYTTCHDILTQLGETIPQLLETKEATKMIETTSKSVHNISDTDLLEMKEMDEKHSACLKFYTFMAIVSFFAKPNMLAFLACRMITLTMRHGICKYSIMGITQYAAVKASSTKTKDIQQASRLGKAAVSCLKKRFHSTEGVAQVPMVYLSYYCLTAFHTEKLQFCANMLRQGFDVGMSVGDSTTAFLNSAQHIKTSFIAGEKLPILLEQLDYYLKLSDQYKNKLVNMYLLIFRDTISALIDRGKSTSLNTNSSSNENDVKTSPHASGAINFHRALQAFWLGHNDRCQYFLVKVLQSRSVTAKLGNIVAMFIHGLNSFQLLKRQDTIKLRAIPKSALRVLKAASSHSEWNFRNKVCLLEAEIFAHSGRHEEAKTSYDASIASARSSGFVHEQGLACEFAGAYFKKIRDHRTALSYLSQAKQCYADWGSQMKVDSINHQIEHFEITLTQGQGMS